MARHGIGHFTMIPRGRRAKPHLAAVRASSKLFKRQLAVDDASGMERSSERAWNAFASLFEILRGEDDEGYIPAPPMRAPTGYIASGVSPSERSAMIANARIDRQHSACGPLTLREALNKLAHYKSDSATFRVDNRGAHYLVLGGVFHKKHWIAEILVSALFRNAAAAAAAIKWHP